MENLESRYRVTGMDCASCGSKVDAAVRKLPGVTDVAVAVSSGVLKVQHGADFAGEGVLRQVRNLGYGVEVLAPLQPSAGSTMAPPGDDHRAASGPWWWTRKAKLTAACGVALVAAYIFGALFPAMERGAFLVALAVGLAPVGWRAITAARYGTPFSIEMLMTIAAVGAVFIGAAEEAAAVVLLFLVGEMLEGVAAGRARKSIQGLTDLVPKTALVEIDGQVSEVPAESLALGAVILVRPGDRVPADGDVVEGEGEIDEAPVTGESVPKRKMAGDPVFAGTINVGGVLRVRVTAAAADNTIARVVRLVEEAQESKSPTERFIDRSTPAAIAAGLSAGARRGLLMKGGAVLETLGKITAVAFDKTGTLTSGKPIVTDIVADARTEGEVLSMAAALETGSSHPLALAILNRAKADGVSIPAASSARAIPGEGVEGTVSGAQVFLGSPQAVARRVGLSASQDAAIAGFNAEGKTVSVVVIDGQSAGFLAMRDEARPDATAGLARLEAMKIRAIMLTGDNRRTAEAVANGLGVEVRADIGIAMGGGADVALETADAAVRHGRVQDVPDMIDLSRGVMGNIRQNITIALGLKAVFLVTTVIGVTGLWPAILADTGATVLVTANAMRLLRWRPK
ncbi:MAG: heavy metal translocating P-type ATPase [Brevundimonas diminuta]|nr:heavy metal translocating P-type ATPase [Brevundimonas diminuta]